MKKILLIDDVKDLADVLADTLRMHDYEVLVSYSGQQALDILKNDPEIGLVVTDIIMPDIDGIDIIDHIREHYAGLPIIAMSGGGVSLQSGDVLKIVEEKVTAFLNKPICVDSFVKKVAEILAP